MITATMLGRRKWKGTMQAHGMAKTEKQGACEYIRLNNAVTSIRGMYEQRRYKRRQVRRCRAI